MDSIEELKVTVSSETARAIREMVEDGSYASVGEVMSAALEALKREEEDHAARLASIKARIEASFEKKGPGHTGAEVRASLQEQARILSGGRDDSAA